MQRKVSHISHPSQVRQTRRLHSLHSNLQSGQLFVPHFPHSFPCHRRKGFPQISDPSNRLLWFSQPEQWHTRSSAGNPLLVGSNVVFCMVRFMVRICGQFNFCYGNTLCGNLNCGGKTGTNSPHQCARCLAGVAGRVWCSVTLLPRPIFCDLFREISDVDIIVRYHMLLLRPSLCSVVIALTILELLPFSIRLHENSKIATAR